MEFAPPPPSTMLVELVWAELSVGFDRKVISGRGRRDEQTRPARPTD